MFQEDFQDEFQEGREVFIDGWTIGFDPEFSRFIVDVSRL